MKVLVLFDVAQRAAPEADITPETLKKDGAPTEADVLEGLGRLGHQAEPLAVYDNVAGIIEKIKSFQPEVVFNLSESFHHDRSQEPNVPALLELLKVPYTGSTPEALFLCKDKVLSKKILSFHGVRLPRFVVSRQAHPLRKLKRFQYPAFVKPAGEEASDGISKASFVRTETEALERARFVEQKFHCDVLIEEYIDGRELYVSVLGSQRPTVLPCRELFFEDVPGDAPKFATFHAKWNEEYREKWGIQSGPARPLPDGVEGELDRLARSVYSALKIRGPARMDVRLTPAGEVYFLEANANPCLAKDEDFAQAAAQAGMDYDTLIQRVLDSALA